MAAAAPHGNGIYCANARAAGCNWFIPPGTTTGFCAACKHNNTVPNAGQAENPARWAEIEGAKRQLFYAILRWNLPHPTKAEDMARGLAFDFLADAQNPDGSIQPVVTGHNDGLITLNLAEGDDAIRIARKSALAEPYRTIIGHMRHEVGHYYWALLLENTAKLEAFRALFGDERADYADALQRHYDQGAPAGWAQSYISAYATAHPWEDFAETWAHWMHIVDGLETARAYGISPWSSPEGPAATLPDDPYAIGDIAGAITAWVPLTIAVNAMNRGMGQPDLYPFVLSHSVAAKLQFINDLIRRV